jgi:hypothetical protein
MSMCRGCNARRESGFFRFRPGHRFASSVLMDPISKAFVEKLGTFATQHVILVVAFGKGERKDDVAARYLSAFQADEGRQALEQWH